MCGTRKRPAPLSLLGASLLTLAALLAAWWLEGQPVHQHGALALALTFGVGSLLGTGVA